MKRNFLIVEDEPSARILIRKVLEGSSIEIGDIYEAENGEKGILALEKHKIDVMLVDIYMPVMDGIEMLEFARDHPAYKDIPAIVVSMENDEDRINAIVRSGLSFVHKPFTKELLEKEILKLTDDQYV